MKHKTTHKHAEEIELYEKLLAENEEVEKREEKIKCPIEMEIHYETGTLRNWKFAEKDEVESELLIRQI